ncbi:GGDEF domain-containing protein [Alcanivorax sp. S6407]|uniref:GGDEF domain-containing protein n=1 Tax=Alcanivorax sp. S6407 TaxID=2926424 RepID=UPI001FF415BF|nr:GGDEF domain-containing protein [Alcanivorax sp. S6407]
MFTLIPENPPERAVRIRRQFMALYSYCLLWFGTFMGVELTAFDPATPHITIFTLLFSVNVLFYGLIRSGYSERFSDPSLTVMQMVTGILAVTAVLYFSRELRGAMLSIYLMVMTFGVISLDRRRLLWMAVFIQACFTTLLIGEGILAPQQVIFSYQLGHWFILALVLASFVYVGGYIHNLQSRVREQREHLREAHDRLAAIATRDELTGLYNRRYFLGRLEEEMALASRSGSSLHLAIIDLDHFKQVNDTYGHPAGDEVIRRFSAVASVGLRRSDILARYGGEEFVVLFPHVSTEACVAALNRLRDEFSAQKYPFADELRNTFSAGVVQYQQNETAQDVTRRADEALYRAKSNGRNCVIKG